MKRSIAAFAAIAGLLAFTAPAVAGEAPPTDTSAAPTTSTPSTETTSTPATTTSAPATTTTVPATTTTTVPATTTTTVPATTTTTVPTTTDVPVTTDTTTEPCAVDCIPNPEGDPCIGPDCVPSTPIGGAGGVPTATIGSGTLPFTGIGDMIAPILLALVVVIGGVVAWRWAQLREAVAEAATRARQLPARMPVRTGYDGATRQLHIEQRARKVFVPRVA